MGDAGKAGTELIDQAIDWLVSLDGGTADEQAFEAWRAADPRHAAAFAQVAATWRRTTDPRLAFQLESPAATAPEPKPTGVSRRAALGGIAAAALGLGGAGAFLAWPSRASAATAVGERRTIRLPDGSHAMLNTDTRVSWRFEKGRDFWIERGEAALLVSGADQPFRVYSDPIDARLSPGRFTIRLRERGGELLVLAGRAAAAYRGTRAETVLAGSLLTVTDGAAGITALPPDALAAATAWEQGKIVFNGMPLDRAIAEFNRYLASPIVMGDPDLARIRLGGEFAVADPATFLMALKEGFNIGHRQQDGQIILFRAG